MDFLCQINMVCTRSRYLLGGLNGDPGSPSDGPPPANATLWGIAAAALTNLARVSDPQLRYVHIGNEPNARWFASTAQCSCGATPSNCTCQPYADFFTAAATQLKARVTDVQVGGPVLCWPLTIGGQTGLPGSYTWYLRRTTTVSSTR